MMSQPQPQSQSQPKDQPFDARAFHARHELAMIVACSENGVIGAGGDLPWRLPADLRHFMRSTKGCPVIMGRKTFDSLDKPLPDRLNIVVSRSMPSRRIAPNVQVTRDLDAAIVLAGQHGELDRPIWIAGGGTIYSQSMGRVSLVVRTLVQARVEGDTVFPDLDPAGWACVRSEQHLADDRNSYGFRIEWWVANSQTSG